MSPSFITMQGHKYSHICDPWGKFLPAGMICTTTNTITVPVGKMYLLARMFCTLTSYVFYSHGYNVRAWNLFWASVAKSFLWQLMILLPCTLPHVFYSHGCNKFLHARTFFTLTDMIAPIFKVITEVWPRSNSAMVTNNQKVLIEGFRISCTIIMIVDELQMRTMGKKFSLSRPQIFRYWLGHELRNLATVPH